MKPPLHFFCQKLCIFAQNINRILSQLTVMTSRRPARNRPASTNPSSRRAPSRRRKPRSFPLGPVSVVTLLVLVLAGTRYLHGCDKADVGTPVDLDGPITAVVTDPALQQTLVEYSAMTVSFNPRLHIPNWVSWEISANHIDGPHSRTNNFQQDTRVRGCPAPSDYTNSGFDRGHMAPAGDMKWSADAMAESFYMTNMVPQSPDLNRGTWNKIEQKCRDRARRDSVVYIVSGPILSTPDAISHFIGGANVAVPRRFFKVVMSPYARPPRAIGFILDNAPTPGGMQAAATTVDEVERITGHDFFSALPDSLENILESEFNFSLWSRLK